MSLTRTQVEGIAHLARLEITEAQMPVYVDSLSRIIEFVEQIDVGRHDWRRADGASARRPGAAPASRTRCPKTNQRDKYQHNAASVAAGLYLVPKVIE